MSVFSLFLFVFLVVFTLLFRSSRLPSLRVYSKNFDPFWQCVLCSTLTLYSAKYTTYCCFIYFGGRKFCKNNGMLAAYALTNFIHLYSSIEHASSSSLMQHNTVHSAACCVFMITCSRRFLVKAWVNKEHGQIMENK